MVRPTTGNEALAKALEAVASAKTADQLRIAQAVLLPLQPGMTLEETARVVGRSVGWVARKRREFICNDGVIRPAAPRGGRRYSLIEESVEFDLIRQAVMHSYKTRCDMKSEIRRRLEGHLERDLSESTLYSIIDRFGKKMWTKNGGYYKALGSCNELHERFREQERVLERLK